MTRKTKLYIDIPSASVADKRCIELMQQGIHVLLGAVFSQLSEEGLLRLSNKPKTMSSFIVGTHLALLEFLNDGYNDCVNEPDQEKRMAIAKQYLKDVGDLLSKSDFTYQDSDKPKEDAPADTNVVKFPAIKKGGA